MTSDAAAVPAKEGVRRDEPALTPWPRECSGEGAEQGLVGVGETGPLVPATE